MTYTHRIVIVGPIAGGVLHHETKLVTDSLAEVLHRLRLWFPATLDRVSFEVYPL